MYKTYIIPYYRQTYTEKQYFKVLIPVLIFDTSFTLSDNFSGTGALSFRLSPAEDKSNGISKRFVQQYLYMYLIIKKQFQKYKSIWISQQLFEYG